MRVFVGPRTDLDSGGLASAAARGLAGPEGPVVSLRHIGVTNLSRRLSGAEVARLREALAVRAPAGGGAPAARSGTVGQDVVVGYVCEGAAVAGRSDPAVRLVAVTDHANLTWRSPLTGPNDDSVGPRFPSMTGIYAPEAVLDRLGGAEGMIVVPGIVAGVADDHRLNAFETEVVGRQAYQAVSSELVPVVIVAAHMGLRVAAVVVTAGSLDKGEG